VNFEFYIKRGYHPFFRAIYANGYIKDFSLRRFNPQEVLDELIRSRNSFGRRAVAHAGYKVATFKKSIQGLWTSNMWNTYPKHDILEYKTMPLSPVKGDDYLLKKNLKKRPPRTYTRVYKRTNYSFNQM
jgi:hypothetical protein